MFSKFFKNYLFHNFFILTIFFKVDEGFFYKYFINKLLKVYYNFNILMKR